MVEEVKSEDPKLSEIHKSESGSEDENSIASLTIQPLVTATSSRPSRNVSRPESYPTAHDPWYKPRGGRGGPGGKAKNVRSTSTSSDSSSSPLSRGRLIKFKNDRFLSQHKWLSAQLFK